MADEQLSLTIEGFAESVRTAMTKDDADESLQSLFALIEKENNPESISHGRLHELTGQIFRSLLPAFVMTDADFKAPASLAAPTKAMQAVKEASVSWLSPLVASVPSLGKGVEVDRVAYRRRMRMGISTVPSPDEGDDNGDGDDVMGEDAEDVDSDENTPPSDANSSPDAKPKKGQKKPIVRAPTEPSMVVLDPLVALMERMAVRCPDKTEWRRSICDSIAVACKGLKSTGIPARYLSRFLLKLLTSEKAAWRIFAGEAIVAVLPYLDTDSLHLRSAAQIALLTRCRDTVPGVRSVAMKSAASVYVSSANPDMTDALVLMLKERSVDEKPSVRRSAISVFDTLVSEVGLGILPLSVLEQLTLDESLMVRKASIASVVALLAEPRFGGLSTVTDLWARTVLHMVTDVESTVVEKVVESFETCVIALLLDSRPSPSLAPILTSIGGAKDSLEFARRVVKSIVRRWDGKSNKQFATALEKHISVATESAIQVSLWAMLEEVTATAATSVITPAKVLQMYPSTTSNVAVHGHCLRIMQMIFSKGLKVDAEVKSTVIESLTTLVSEPQPALTILHDALRCLHAGLVSSEENGKKTKSVMETLLASAESALDKIIYDAIMAPKDVPVYAWYVATIGELAGLGYMPSAKGLTAIEAVGTNRVYHNGSEHFPLPPSLRAAAMVAFGKICLEKESIAKRAVSKFAAHLSKEEHPVVRNNVLIVLGDLCVVYTGLVDQYLPWLTTCLSDPNDLIRFQAAVVVSSLLAEDYIKFKGQIVFRLLYLLSDPNVKIRYFVESVFSRILFLRHSGSLKTLFAETVCALNGYLRHPAFQGATGNRDFVLTANPSRRREIYQFMLTTVATTEQKFNAMVQLANSLLAAFVDEDATNGAVFIPERDDGPAGQVLVDTLWLLSCPELKLSSGGVFGTAAAAGAAPVDEADAEDKDSREKRLFDAALQKKTVVENLVPLLIQLNSICEQKRSSISRYVRDCLKELVKDYKDEVRSILHSDSQLAQELIYDMGEAVGAGAVVPVDTLEDVQPEAAPAEPLSRKSSSVREASPRASPVVGRSNPPRSSVSSSVHPKASPMVDLKANESDASVEAPRKSRRRAKEPEPELSHGESEASEAPKRKGRKVKEADPTPQPAVRPKRGKAAEPVAVKEEEERPTRPARGGRKRGGD